MFPLRVSWARHRASFWAGWIRSWYSLSIYWRPMSLYYLTSTPSSSKCSLAFSDPNHREVSQRQRLALSVWLIWVGSTRRRRQTGSVYRVHRSRFHLKTETEFSLRNGDRDYLYLLGSSEYVPREDADRIHSPKRRQTCSIYWAHLSRFHMKTETESSLRNVAFWIKDITMDNVQNCDSYINIPSPTNL
jgi:hypothetical protein